MKAQIFAAILVANPIRGRRQRFAETKDPLETRKGDLDPLPEAGVPLCPLGLKQNPNPRQSLLEIFAAVGEDPQKPPGDTVSQSPSSRSSSVRVSSATLAGVIS